MADVSESLYLVLLLFHLADVSKTETFKVLGPAEPLVATIGDDIILPCYLKPNISAEDLEVRWFRDEFLSPVHLYVNGRNNFERQMKSYWGRTALFKDELIKGNTSLKLLQVESSDDGYYKCFVQLKEPKYEDDYSVKLTIKAIGSQPLISLQGYMDGGISLACETKGWYPEPEVFWLDSEGQKLTTVHVEVDRDTKGLFLLKQQIIVFEKDNNGLTCRVVQQQFNQMKEASINIPSEIFPHAHPWTAVLFVLFFLVLGIIVGLTIAYLRLRRKKDHLFIRSENLAHEMDKLSRRLDSISKQLGVQFVDSNRDELIQQVDPVQPIISGLLQKNLIQTDIYNRILMIECRMEQMGLLYNVMDSAGDTVKAEFYAILMKKYPQVIQSTLSVEFERVRKDMVDVTFDADTAHPCLHVSKDRKRVRDGDNKQDLPDTPLRFNDYHCLLGQPGFSSGRAYYQVIVGQKTEWDLGVASESSKRKGWITLKPGNGYWVIGLRNTQMYKTYTDPTIPLYLKMNPCTIGIYVDYDRGQVSFYNVEAKTHIYSFTGYSFMGKLYPFFSPGRYSSKNSECLVI